MKKIITFAALLIILGIVFSQKETILDYYNQYKITNYQKSIVLNKNEYYRDYSFNFVQTTDNFIPESKKDLLNIFYTAINSGQNHFTFYCPNNYKECAKEVQQIANNQTLLSHINNFVHPYNGFKHIETEYDSLGKVTITTQKNYTTSDITAISDKINNIINEIITPNASDEEKVKTIHDYIINNSKYDSARSDQNIINYKSDIAYGPLLEGYGICGGYTDAMELFLEKLNIKSYRISSENHVWNAVYLNNNWYHLDLTWDDPVTPNNQDLLQHDFFLINTNRLIELEKQEHTFDQTIYQELKEV